MIFKPAPTKPFYWISAFSLVITQALTQAQGLSTPGWKGKIDGVWTWQLMETANGLKPTQSWHCVGSSPEGDIYVGGMDHVKNAAIYRIEPSKGTLRYVGDARTAAGAANNLQAGDMIEKFHTRPHWHNGRMYVANMNRSYANEEYLSVRGFHWWAYDITADQFIDLSAKEPGGSAVDKGGVVSLTSDLRSNVLYGGQEPHGKLYKYDIAAGKTTDLGRPMGLSQKYVYTPRVMWVDSRGKLYWGMGKAWYFADINSVTDHMHVYDPKSGWSERRDWKFAEPLVGGKYDGMEAGQWTIDRKQFIVMDDRMRIYRFDDAAESFGLVGKADYGGSETWVWHVAASGKKAYFMPSDPAEGLFEYDLEKKSTVKLCGISELDDKAGAVTRHTGYDGWDADGKFYFTSFKRDGTENVMISSIDPVRLKVAKNLLPGIVEVTVEAAANGFTFSRKGPTTSALEVVYRITENNTASPAYAPQMGRIAMPAGSATVKLAQASLNLKDPAAKSITVSVIPDGDTYLAGTARNATLGESGLMVRHVGYNGLKPWLSVSGAAGALSLNLDLPSTWMGGPLTLRLLSISGQVLRSYSLTGNARQVLSWNGRNTSGVPMAPGLVIAELKGKTFSAHARLSDSP